MTTTAQDVQQVAQYARNSLDTIKELLQLGVDVSTLIAQTVESLTLMSDQKRGPTGDEWDAQNAAIRDLRQSLQSD